MDYKIKFQVPLFAEMDQWIARIDSRRTNCLTKDELVKYKYYKKLRSHEIRYQFSLNDLREMNQFLQHLVEKYNL